jgi:hypothetical protein
VACGEIAFVFSGSNTKHEIHGVGQIPNTYCILKLVVHTADTVHAIINPYRTNVENRASS